MKKFLNRLRYNYYFSWLAQLLAKPVERLCAGIARQLRMKVWANGCTVNYDGIDLSFPKDIGVSYSSNIFWSGADGFEPATWRVMKHFLGGAQLFVDVGANLGIYSVLARKLRAGIRIMSFEPVPSIFAKSAEFHQANACSTDGMFNSAIGDTQARAKLLLPVEADGLEEETTATLRQDSWQNRHSNIEFEVEVSTLDHVLKDVAGGTKVLVKVDVEDFEENVLTGAMAAAARLKPVFICEILPRAHGNQQTAALISRMDYVAFGITSNGLVRFNQADFAQKRGFTDFLLIHASAATHFLFVPFAALDQFTDGVTG